MQTALTLQELYTPVASEMDRVRALVAQVWTEAIRLVHGPAAEVPLPGGKMLRPALCFMAAGAVGAKDIARFAPLAAAMELLHMAALAHDDVIDDSDMRRGMRSWNAQWDNHTAVLGGDYLVARAIALMGTSYDSCAVVVNAIDSVRMMAEGELENFGLGKDHYSREAAISLAKQKTASLFAVTCSTPTYLVDTKHRDALHEYGMSLGIAFQLADDVLDLVQDRETLGKPSCGDIVEGKKTVPIIALRESLDAPGVDRLAAMTGRELTGDDRDWVAAMMESTGAREKTEAMARSYCEAARASLDGLPPTPYKDAMIAITDFVIARES